MTERQVSVTREIKATPEAIFELLTDPARHGDIDGSGMVQAARGDAQKLSMGSKFGMSMKMGPMPYRITNKVVEFEANKLIAWTHLGGHRWRYELEPVDGGRATKVTETFDWSTAKVPKLIELVGYPEKHPASMEATLERLANVVEN